MSAGALNFTLGLNSSQFLTALQGALGRLAALTGGALTAGYAMSKLGQAIEQGGKLFDQSRLTGAGVADLYKLGKAFEQIGGSAEAASPMLLKLQRAVGGAEGKSAIKALGLDVEALKKQSGAEQIDTIAKAMGKLSATGQAGAAFAIFGREGALDMLSVVRNADDFREAMAAVAKDSKVWADNAGKLDRLGDLMAELRGKINTLWAQAAGGIADFVDGFKRAMEGMQLDIFIGVSLQAGFEASVEWFGKAMVAVVGSIKVVFETMLSDIGRKTASNGATNAAQRFLRNSMMGELAQRTLGALDQSASPEARAGDKIRVKELQAQIAILQNEILATSTKGEDFSKKYYEQLGGSFRMAMDASAGFSMGRSGRDALASWMLQPLGPPKPPGLGGAGEYDAAAAKEKGYKPEFTNLEKMGFVMGGGSNPMLDAAKRTARGVEQLVKLAGRTLIGG
jgi:hypothetical protein